jgi:hypothetical protein
LDISNLSETSSLTVFISIEKPKILFGISRKVGNGIDGKEEISNATNYYDNNSQKINLAIPLKNYC